MSKRNTLIYINVSLDITIGTYNKSVYINRYLCVPNYTFTFAYIHTKYNNE